METSSQEAVSAPAPFREPVQITIREFLRDRGRAARRERKRVAAASRTPQVLLGARMPSKKLAEVQIMLKYLALPTRHLKVVEREKAVQEREHCVIELQRLHAYRKAA